MVILPRKPILLSTFGNGMVNYLFWDRFFEEAWSHFLSKSFNVFPSQMLNRVDNRCV